MATEHWGVWVGPVCGPPSLPTAVSGCHRSGPISGTPEATWWGHLGLAASLGAGSGSQGYGLRNGARDRPGRALGGGRPQPVAVYYTVPVHFGVLSS